MGSRGKERAGWRDGGARRASLGLAAVTAGGLLSADPAFAGAWTYPAGTGQVIVSTILTEGEERLAGRGGAIVRQAYRKAESNAYLEYGFTDWLTGIAVPDFQAVSVSAPAAAQYEGLGQSGIGARARIFQTADSVFSFQAMVAVPPRGHPVNDAEIGATDFQTEARLLAGHNFQIGAWAAFADAQIAYRARLGAPADEIHVDLTLGIRPALRWLVMLQSFSTVSAGPARPPFLRGSEHKLELSLTYDVSRHWSVQVGALATVAARNLMRQRGMAAALWRRF